MVYVAVSTMIILLLVPFFLGWVLALGAMASAPFAPIFSSFLVSLKKWRPFPRPRLDQAQKESQRIINETYLTNVGGLVAEDRHRHSTFERVMDEKIFVFGVFRNRRKMERAVTALASRGIGSSDISIFEENSRGVLDTVAQNASRAEEFGIAGIILGLVVGGACGVWGGNEILFIPGISLSPIAGRIAAALLMGVICAMWCGILAGGLGLSVSKYGLHPETGRFPRTGRFVVSLHLYHGEQMDWVKGILFQGGACRVGTVPSHGNDHAAIHARKFICYEDVPRAGSPR